MKRIILLIVPILLLAAPSFAETYSSSFGFSVDIPEHWLIMSKEELRDNPDLFNYENEAFKKIDKSVFEQTRELISSGNVEIYYNQITSDTKFSDNINVTKRIGRLPRSPSESQEVCSSLSVMLSKIFGKSVDVYECGLQYIGGIDAFYSEFDGVIDGTRSMQYQIEKSSGVLIIFTATCKNETEPVIKKEFKNIVSSIIIE